MCFAEEKLTGIATPRKKYDIRIPHKNDPFDKDKLKEPPLKGHDVFSPDPATPLAPSDTVWTPSTETDLSKLTCGFEDNFIDTWSRPSSDLASIRRGLFARKSQESIFEDEDPIFRTVSGEFFIYVKPEPIRAGLIKRWWTRLVLKKWRLFPSGKEPCNKVYTI